jgi:SAM-dependent methyltransferase
MSALPDHVIINRDAWTRANAAYTHERARSAWAQEEITWGIWEVPEAVLGTIPDVNGKDVIELGCGTGYFGARLKRRGARRVLGVDITPAQLDTARQCEAEFELGLEFLEANAEEIPFGSAQFDLAVSEYGASIWCDPELWIAEAARLLRPGGELVFLRNSTLSLLCTPDTGQVQTTLQRPQRGMCRLQWTDDDPGVEFHPGTGEMVRLLRKAGFILTGIVEIFAPAGAQNHPYYDYVPAAWAKNWPAEEIWRAYKSDEIQGIGQVG